MGLIASTLQYETDWFVDDSLVYRVQDTEDFTTELCTGKDLVKHFNNGVHFDNLVRVNSWKDVALYPCYTGDVPLFRLDAVGCMVAIVKTGKTFHSNFEVFEYWVLVDEKLFKIPVTAAGGLVELERFVPILSKDKIVLHNLGILYEGGITQDVSLTFKFKGTQDKVRFGRVGDVISSVPSTYSQFLRSLILEGNRDAFSQ